MNDSKDHLSVPVYDYKITKFHCEDHTLVIEKVGSETMKSIYYTNISETQCHSFFHNTSFIYHIQYLHFLSQISSKQSNDFISYHKYKQHNGVKRIQITIITR